MGMSKITHIVVHYSATYADQDWGVAEIDAMHKKRGWKGVGYHYVIRRNGKVEKGRPDNQIGAHVGGQNSGKLGICCIGGLERATGPNVGVDNRTAAQIVALITLIRHLLVQHPGAKVVGHRDLAATQCPGFDVIPWWKAVQEEPPVPPAKRAPTASPRQSVFPAPPRSSVDPQPPSEEGKSGLAWIVGLIAVAAIAAALFII